MILSLIIFLSIVSAALYRLGGIGKPFDTKYRDFGTPLCALIILILCSPGFSWKLAGALSLSLGLMFGSMTTYFKRKGKNVQFINWVFVSIAFSLSILPYVIVTGEWFAFALRSVSLIVALPLACQLIGWDDLEEGCRGFLFSITLIFFYIS